MKTTYTKEQKKAYFAEKRAKYLEALKTMQGKLEKDYICYNAFTGKPYSANNHCFIAFFGGQAGAYAGFAQWKQHGYSVKKGAHGVCIVQPIVRTKETQNEDGSTDTVANMVNVSYATVFHFSQVEPMDGKEQAEVSKPTLAETQTSEAESVEHDHTCVNCWKQLSEADTYELNGSACCKPCLEKEAETVQPEPTSEPKSELEKCKEVIKQDNPNDWPF